MWISFIFHTFFPWLDGVLFHCGQFSPLPARTQPGGDAGDGPDQGEIGQNEGNGHIHIPVGVGDDFPEQLQQRIALGVLLPIPEETSPTC